jgi:hypothetical protein
MRPVSGIDFLNALVVGVEVSVIGNAVYRALQPGTLPARRVSSAPPRPQASSSTSRAADAPRPRPRLDTARGSSGNVRHHDEGFHPGRAERADVRSCSRDFTSSTQSLEAKYSWANILNTTRDYSQITKQALSTWEIAVNTYKPFACGIVMHPRSTAAFSFVTNRN